MQNILFILFYSFLYCQPLLGQVQKDDRIRLTPFGPVYHEEDETSLETLENFDDLLSEENLRRLTSFWKELEMPYSKQNEKSQDQQWLEEMNSIYRGPNVPIKLEGAEYFAHRAAFGHYKKLIRQEIDRQIELRPYRRFQIEQEGEKLYSALSRPFRSNVFAIRFPGYWIGYSEEKWAPKARVIGERIEILKIGKLSLNNEMRVHYDGEPFLGIIFTYIPGFEELSGTVHFGNRREDGEENGGRSDEREDRQPWRLLQMVEGKREKKFPEERWYDITADLKIGTGLSTSNFNPFRKILFELIFDFARNKHRFIQSYVELEYNPPENFSGDGDLTLFVCFIRKSF